jgi:hypothetical protein
MRAGGSINIGMRGDLYGEMCGSIRYYAGD